MRDPNYDDLTCAGPGSAHALTPGGEREPSPALGAREVALDGDPRHDWHPVQHQVEDSPWVIPVIRRGDGWPSVHTQIVTTDETARECQ